MTRTIKQGIIFSHNLLIPAESDLQDILFIIPAFNEEDCIGFVIDEIRNITPLANILVINDGSVDNTATVAINHGAEVLNLSHNLGIGGAVSAGLTLADELGYQYVVRMDADGQHNPEDICRLVLPVRENQANVVFGARFCLGEKSYCQSFLRKVGIRFYGLVVSIIIKQKIHDATSGFWCLDRSAIRYFANFFPQDYPEVESHVLLYKAGLRQMEIPVTMRKRVNGHSSIGLFRSIYYAFKVLLAVCIRAIQDAPCLSDEESIQC